MQNLKSLSNEVLLQKTQSLVAEERKLTTSVLWHLHEIQRRRLYSEKGYGSLFDYAVRELGYSEAAAGRRINAMRLLAEVPEIEPALETGKVNLSTLSTIQHFFQRKDEPVSKAEKRELVFALQGKSRRECEKELSALDPKAAIPQERERVVSLTQTELRFVADDALMDKLQKIRELDGHVLSGGSYLERFHRMADLALKNLETARSAKVKNDSTLKTTRSTPPAGEKSPAAPKNPRMIPAALKRAVWARDRSQCSYISPEGRHCGSRFALEIDHRTPITWGGKTEVANLQLLCRDHNRFKAIAQLGRPVMQSFLKC